MGFNDNRYNLNGSLKLYWTLITAKDSYKHNATAWGRRLSLVITLDVLYSGNLYLNNPIILVISL